MEHSPTSATGGAWERTPWHATQRAAWNGYLLTVVCSLDRWVTPLDAELDLLQAASLN
jgi:hypothetical protein